MQLERRSGHITDVLCEQDYTEWFLHSVQHFNLEMQ